MTTLRFGAIGLMLTLALASSRTSQAGPLSTYLTDDGVIEFLEDEDFESLIDVDGKGIGSGDLFVGIFSIASVNNDPDADDIQLTTSTGGVKGILVAAIDTYDAGTGYITFRAVTTTEYDGLRDGSLVPGGTALTNLPTSIAAGTALVVYESPVGTSTGVSKGTNVAGSDWSQINSVGLASVLAGGATIAYELGWNDGGFAEAQFNANGTGQFDFRLALNVTANPIGIYLNNITTAMSGYTMLSGAALPTAAIHISGNSTDVDLSGGPPATTLTNNTSTGSFFYRTDANMKVNAYPEPGSFTLLGLGALGLLGGALRRRRNAA